MTVIIPLVREARTSEDGQKMTGMTGCVSLKKILLLITTLFFSKSLRKKLFFFNLCLEHPKWEATVRVYASAPLCAVIFFFPPMASRLNEDFN